MEPFFKYFGLNSHYSLPSYSPASPDLGAKGEKIEKDGYALHIPPPPSNINHSTKSSDILLSKYTYKFDQIDPSLNQGNEATRLKEQVLAIEEFIQAINLQMESDKKRLISRYIDSVLNGSSSINSKLIELGSLLFFLKTEGNINIQNKLNFYTRLKNKINSTLDRIEKSSSSMSQQSSALKEKRKFLRLLFAEIIAGHDQKVNIGGIFTVYTLLTQEYCMKFSEENRIQIRQVLFSMMKNPAIVTELEKPLDKIDTLLASYLLKELGIGNPDKAFFSAVAARAALLALFEDLRQDDSNCYAIAPLIYAIHHSPYKVLTNLLQLIREGGITVDGDKFIPISNMLKNRFKEHGNVLQQMLVITIEFLETNLTKTADRTSGLTSYSTKQTIPRPVKARLIRFIRDDIVNQMKIAHPQFSHSNDYEDFYSIFLDYCKNYFWLENCVDKTITISDNLMHFQDQMVLDVEDFTGPLEELKLLYACHRELFFLNSVQFVKIETVADFQEVLVKLLAKTAEEVFQDALGHPLYQFFLNQFKKMLSSRITQEALATFMWDVNREEFPNLTVEHYKSLNVILFAQDGGYAQKKPFEYLDLSCNSAVFSSQKAVDNISAICKWLASQPWSLNFFRNEQPPFLCTSHNHAFILTPYRFNPIWKQTAEVNNVDDLINKLMIHPAHQLLQQHIGVDKIHDCLKACGLSQNLIDSITLDNIGVTNLQFKEYMQTKYPLLKSQFKKAFHKTLTMLTYKQVMELKLPQQILCKIVREESEVKRTSIENSFYMHLNFATENSHSPRSLSRLLKKVLVQNGIYYIEDFQIEWLICMLAKLPNIFEIADLNFADEQKRKHHNLMTFSYDLGEGDIVLGARCKDEDSLLPNNILKALNNVTLYYPKLS